MLYTITYTYHNHFAHFLCQCKATTMVCELELVYWNISYFTITATKKTRPCPYKAQKCCRAICCIPPLKLKKKNTIQICNVSRVLYISVVIMSSINKSEYRLIPIYIYI